MSLLLFALSALWIALNVGWTIGVRTLLARRSRWVEGAPLRWVWASSIAALLCATALLARLWARGVIEAAALGFLALSTWGLVHWAGGMRERLRSTRGKGGLLASRWQWAPEFLIGVLGLALWVYWLRDVDGLPSHHDGVVHSVFFERILTLEWRAGRFPLWFSQQSLREIFGNQPFQFYPQGAHLLAVLQTRWMTLLPISTATVLLSTLVAINTGFAMLAARVARDAWGLLERGSLSLLPRKAHLSAKASAAAALASGLFALTYNQLPEVPTEQGGWSRLVGYLLALAWGSALTLRAPRTEWPRLLNWSAAPVLIAVGLIHPASLATGLFFLLSLWSLAPDRLRLVPATLASLAAGVLAYAWLRPLQSHLHSLDQLTPLLSGGVQRMAEVWSHVVGSELFGEKIVRHFSPVSRRSVSFIGFAFAVGAAVRHRHKGLRLALAVMVIWMAAVTAVVLGKFEAFWFLRPLTAPFYGDPARISESVFFLRLFCWALGLAVIAAGVARAFESRRPGWRIAAALAVAAIVADHGSRLFWGVQGIDDRLAWFAQEHLFPRHSASGDWMRLLEREWKERTAATRDARRVLLLAAPFTADGWEFRLPRGEVQALLQYGECPIGPLSENARGVYPAPSCAKRWEFWQQFMAGSRCHLAIPRANRTWAREAWAAVPDGQVPACKPTAKLGSANGLTLYEYADFWRLTD